MMDTGANGTENAGPERIGPRADLTPRDDVIAHRTTRQRRGRRRAAFTLNLTPMIDVTFLLLVYFMVATQFKLGEEIYRLDLPDRRGRSVERDPFELDQEPLRIQVATLGDVRDTYRLRVIGPYHQPTTFDDLHQFLTERRIDPVQSSGLFMPDHPVVIEPTATTSWQHALSAFNAAARAHYTNITLGKAG